MNTKSLPRSLWAILLFVSGLAFTLYDNTEVASALPSMQATPTPITRTPNWRSRQSTNIPRGLHRTARVSYGGGAIPAPDLCTDITTLAGNTAWAFTPDESLVLDDHSFILFPMSLQAQQCGTPVDLNATATVRTPLGEIIQLSFWNDGLIGLRPGMFLHELGAINGAGNYIMTITTQDGVLSHTFSVKEGPSVWIRLADAKTDEMKKTFSPGEAISVRYSGLGNSYGDSIEVGLYRRIYREDTKIDEQNLIDWWTIPKNSDYTELLTLPSNTPEGSYLIMACIDECKLTFFNASLRENLIVYNFFSIEAGSDSISSADNTSASCHDAIQEKIAWDYKGNTNWDESNIVRLCTGNEFSVEPALCFGRVMHEGINWGGGTQWNWENALNLCKGTLNANATIGCFEEQIQQDRGWRTAIETCKNNP